MAKAKSKSSRAAASSPGQPPRLQVAALCWRKLDDRLRILLITSRDTGRWVLPKGWPMRNRTEAEAAAREAYEEAGLRGVVSPRPIGVYTYLKRLPKGRVAPCVVRVYALEARQMLETFPETGQRRAKWFEPEKAAGRVAEHELADLIRSFDPDAAPAEPAEPVTASEQRSSAPSDE